MPIALTMWRWCPPQMHKSRLKSDFGTRGSNQPAVWGMTASTQDVLRDLAPAFSGTKWAPRRSSAVGD